MYEDLKQEIIKYGNLLLAKGLVTGTGGNISVRTPAGTILITPSGIPYEEITPEDIPEMDLEGNIISGTRIPSIEKNMHRAIYLARRDVGAIVHTHSIYASAIAATRQDFEPILDAMVAVFGGGIKTAAYACIGTPELARNVVEALGNRPACLIANHGMVGVGKNLKQAFEICEFTEASAMTYIFAKCLGTPVVLPPEVVAREKQDLDRRYGQLPRE